MTPKPSVPEESDSRKWAGDTRPTLPQDVPMLYYADDDLGQDFERLDGNVDEAFALWRRECERSREIVGARASLDDTGTRVRDGQPVSLRGVLVKMIAEYAQHNGHADLLREGIDGATGH